MDKEQYISEYFKSGGEIFTITNISALRDNRGSLIIKTSIGLEFLIYEDSKTFFYVENNVNKTLIEDIGLKFLLLNQLKKYKEITQFKADKAIQLIAKINN